MFARRVLSVHNFYQLAGGEDQIFASEAALLENNGHAVVRYEEHNSQIEGIGAAAAGVKAIWNRESHRRLQGLIHESHPEVAHFHNTFPLISPAGYYAVRSCGIPVVQELQNFRLLCPAATFLRDGKVCEECIELRWLAPAIAHGCYRGSRAATTAVAAMLAVHRTMGTWHRMVDVYIAPSEFVRRKFIDNGFCAGQIVVKPNPILPDPGPGDGSGAYALFVGRLAEEKGIRTLAAAWQSLPDVPLLVAGGGPLAGIMWPRGVKPLGAQTRKEVLDLMRAARVLIFPSLWYEAQPMTILEALACGLPVVASNLGSVPEMVEHHRTGLLFRPGDAEDLVRQVRWAFEHPEEMKAMRANARREFEEKYTAERNYKALIEIYEMAIENFRRAQHRNGKANRVS